MCHWWWRGTWRIYKKRWRWVKLLDYDSGVSDEVNLALVTDSDLDFIEANISRLALLHWLGYDENQSIYSLLATISGYDHHTDFNGVKIETGKTECSKCLSNNRINIAGSLVWNRPLTWRQVTLSVVLVGDAIQMEKYWFKYHYTISAWLLMYISYY